MNMENKLHETVKVLWSVEVVTLGESDSWHTLADGVSMEQFLEILPSNR